MSQLAPSASFKYICFESTAIINILILSTRRPPSYVRIWRLMRQILRYKYDPRAEKVNDLIYLII